MSRRNKKEINIAKYQGNTTFVRSCVEGQVHIKLNFRFSPCILTVNHFYYPTNALKYTEWAKIWYTVIFFFFTGTVNDGRELKYRTKKVDF